MIYQNDEDREKREQEAPEKFRHLQISRAPTSPPGTNKRFAWPLCAYYDLHPREEQTRPEGEDRVFYCLDDDLPGDSLAVVEYRISSGKIIEAYETSDLIADLPEACPADHLRMTLWTVAAAMDPRSPGVLN